MLEDVLNDEKFALLMKMHVYECIDFLLQNDYPFSVMANFDLVSFSPELPNQIGSQLAASPVIVFALDGYTLQSAQLSQNELSFEAGFGPNDFASLVSFPLGAIVQILVENSPILINFSIYREKQTNKDRLEKSLLAFMSNPNNRKLFKK